VGRGSRPHRHPSWYSTFALFPDTCRRNQPALAQTYATVAFGAGRVSGEQMLTVGRGLWTTATAAVGPGESPQSNVPANSLPRLGPAADSRCSKQHDRCVNIAEVVTLRHTKPGPSAKREIQGRVSSNYYDLSRPTLALGV